MIVGQTLPAPTPPIDVPEGWLVYKGGPRQEVYFDPEGNEIAGLWILTIVEEETHEPSSSGQMSRDGRGWHEVRDVWFERSGDIVEDVTTEWSTSAFARAREELQCLPPNAVDAAGRCVAPPPPQPKPSSRWWIWAALAALGVGGVGVAIAAARK